MALGSILDQADPPLVERAQRYERDALAELFDRAIGRVYALCFALSGRPDDAEALARHALSQALDKLPGFTGDARAFDAWVLRLAVAGAGRLPPPADQLLVAYRRLFGHDQEAVGLRLLVGMDSDRVAQVTRRSASDVRRSLTTSLRRLAGLAATPSEGSLEAFDAALERVLAGGDPVHEGARLLAPPDAVTLLRTAREVTDLPREPLGPHSAARLRTLFLAEGAERRAIWVQRHRVTPMVPGIELRRGRNQVSTGAAILLTALIALAVGGAVAVFSMFAGPDSPVYPVKRFAESALLALNRDPTGRADFELKLASTRGREAEDMAVSGNGDAAVAAMSDHYQRLRAAGYDLANARLRDAHWNDERNRFSSQAAQSTEEIQQDLTANHQRGAAERIKQLAAQFQRDRRQIDAGLGPSPGVPQVSPSPSP